ncbi:fibronectin type III domain-containing protein [Kitasatospora sp. NPDC052896]|uniref:fibronectin type III domain-containing protein n=1 Tax=Kitasatospora sp. NPDC052896 TaxID=3364061 RepID=UPI0037C576E6
MSLYAGFGTGLDYLPYQVYQYFSNGGTQAWVQRATAADAVAASTTILNVPIPARTTQTPTPAGSAPTGTGTAPSSAVTGVVLATVTAPVINPEQAAIGIQWPALTPANSVDAYQVTCTANTPGAVAQSVWVAQGSGNLTATFTGLVPGTTYTFQVVPYKGTSAGPSIATPPTFSTLAPYTAVPALQITSKGVGAYGNSIYVDLVQSWNPGRFHLFVKSGSTAQGSLVESWQDVSLVPTDPRYVVSMVNSSLSGSSYITVANLLPPTGTSQGTGQTPDASWTPVLATGVQLAGGSDGVQAINLATTLANGFAAIEDVLLINLCGNSASTGGIPDQSVISAAMAWVTQRGSAFLVLDAPSVPAPADSGTATSSYLLLLPAATPPGNYQPATSYAAMYGPWVQVSDPAGTSVSSTRMLAPGGSVMGQFAQADSNVGPNQAPAGTDYAIVGAVGVEQLFTNDQLDTLNVAGFNVIRPVPQAGYCIMGVRTIKAGMPDRYIPIRRMLTYLENILVSTTRFAAFKPNGPQLWQKISGIVTQQLTTIMMSGQLAGTIPSQAFFVVCDDTNNTPSTVANGEVHLTVGVALQSPAEYIVIQISQYQGGVSTAVSNLPTG